jgi:hypothetical protein
VKENRSYLFEFEAEFKKALARQTGAQEVLFDEKKRSRKFRGTVPLIPVVTILVQHKKNASTQVKLKSTVKMLMQ